MVIFTRRWTQRGHDMIIGLEWAMLLSVVHVVFWVEPPLQRLPDFC